MNLTHLPDVVLEQIFSFLAYDSIAQNRVVCRKFNEIGSKMLNKGYYAADRFHARTLKGIKSKLPRRESERRVHPLARHCDILIAVETRLSMLAMTFTKWMDAKLCCFIPGKVIDEIMRVLRCVENNPNPPRAHEILQELRDISSMAMEHFDEKILPKLKLTMGGAPAIYLGGRPSKSCKPLAMESVDLLEFQTREELHLIPPKPRLGSSFTSSSGLSVSITEFNKLFIRETLNRRKIKAQAILIAKQANEISELRKHVEEWEAKLRDLTANLIKAKHIPSGSTSPIEPSTSRQTKRKKQLGNVVPSKKLKASKKE